MSGAFIQLKKTQTSPVNTSMSDRDHWCVFTLACVSQSARAASSASSARTFVKAKVGLPACCYKIGSDYQDGETRDGGEEEDKDRKCDRSSDRETQMSEVTLRKRRR